MAGDISGVTDRVREILAAHLSPTDAAFWAPRIAMALVLTAETASTGASVAALTGGVASPTNDVEAVQVGLVALTRQP